MLLRLISDDLLQRGFAAIPRCSRCANRHLLQRSEAPHAGPGMQFRQPALARLGIPTPCLTACANCEAARVAACRMAS